MHYNFFADKQDKLDILDYIFMDTDLRIYDFDSQSGQEIFEYQSISEIERKFDLTYGNKFSVTFQLWTPRHKGEPIFERVELNPKYCKESVFRYSTVGWGLIQLYFGGIENNVLNQSHIGHFNERGALNRESISPRRGKVDEWDWSEINKTSRKLKYLIHTKMSVRKVGSVGVLKGADDLSKQGIEFR